MKQPIYTGSGLKRVVHVVYTLCALLIRLWPVVGLYRHMYRRSKSPGWRFLSVFCRDPGIAPRTPFSTTGRQGCMLAFRHGYRSPYPGKTYTATDVGLTLRVGCRSFACVGCGGARCVRSAFAFTCGLAALGLARCPDKNKQTRTTYFTDLCGVV